MMAMMMIQAYHLKNKREFIKLPHWILRLTFLSCFLRRIIHFSAVLKFCVFYVEQASREAILYIIFCRHRLEKSTVNSGIQMPTLPTVYIHIRHVYHPMMFHLFWDVIRGSVKCYVSNGVKANVTGSRLYHQIYME